ncbi:MAG: serine hydrolase domain-containing protein [Gemmatimonadaceae bacterium]
MYAFSFRALRAFTLVGLATLAAARTSSAQVPSPQALRAAIDSIAEAEIKTGTVAGISIAVMRGDEVIVAKGYGMADVENQVPATENTVYRIGSITKQFTAAAIMQLAEQGKLSLDDELTKYFRDYPTQGRRVTVRHLLNHTSGIRSYTALGPRWFATTPLEVPADSIVALFSREPFDFAPGERFLYNNSGYFLLGLIVEKASGQSYPAYLEEHFFKPLGLSATHYCNERPIIRHRAEGYSVVAGQLANDAPMSMTHPYSAGALCASVLDLLAWQKALTGGKVVSAASYREMTTPRPLPGGAAMSYGYGLGVGDLQGHRKVGHGGGINGFVSQLALYPADSLAIAVLVNTEGQTAGRLERHIAHLALGIRERAESGRQE